MVGKKKKNSADQKMSADQKVLFVFCYYLCVRVCACVPSVWCYCYFGIRLGMPPALSFTGKKRRRERKGGKRTDKESLPAPDRRMGSSEEKKVNTAQEHPLSQLTFQRVSKN